MFSWQYHPYILLMIASLGIALAGAFFVWQRRAAPGAKHLTAIMILLAWWTIALAIEIGGTNAETQFLGLRLEYSGVTFIAPLWLMFVLHYTGRELWLSPHRVLLLFSIPIIGLLILWTNPWHEWFIVNVRLNTHTPVPVLNWEKGLWFWIDLFYMYTLLSLGVVLLVQKLISLPHLYKGQATALFAGLFIFAFTNILYVIKVIPPYIPLGPLAFMLCGLSIVWGLFRFRLLDIVPIARGTVFEAMTDAVIVLDAQHRLIDLNPAAQWLLGTETEAQVGQPAVTLASFITDLLQQAKLGAESEIALTFGEGNAQHFTARIMPLFDHKKRRQTGYVLVLHNVTKLQEALEKAQIADKAKSLFVSNVNHELRTPLTNIKLYLNLLNQGKETRRAFYMDTLFRETERLQDLIENLLDISRLDLGQINMKVQPVNLNDLVKTLAQDRQPLFVDRNLELELSLTEPVFLVSADAKLLEQVLTNLLSNALNYTPPGGKVQLSTDYKTDNGQAWATFSVKDTGPGISTQEQEKLFTRFYRGAASRAPETQAAGTGLGLALSKEIIERHHGHITLESELGHGSTFIVWLPVKI